MKNTAVTICTYHRSFEGDGQKNIIKFKNQNFDNFFVLFDNQKKFLLDYVSSVYENSNVVFYDDDEFVTHGFNKPISKYHYWGSHQNPKYFYAHFRMLCFYLKNKNFDYYWFFDDDVNFEGDLKTFLNNYESIDDDFLVIQAFKKEDYVELPKVPIINSKMNGSRGFWLGHCPGPGDNFKNIKFHVGSFFPIVRFSKRSLEHLYNLHKEGFYGYSEGFVPTSLASDGFSVSCMVNEFNQFYIENNVCDITHKGMKFTWEWL